MNTFRYPTGRPNSTRYWAGMDNKVSRTCFREVFADFEYGEGYGHLEFRVSEYAPGASDLLTWSTVAGRRLAIA